MQILLVIMAAASIGVQCGRADTKVGRSAAQGEWVNCLTSAVERFDDGRSDAASVASGIAPVCAASYRVLVTALVCNAPTPHAQLALSQNSDALEQKLATSAVLAYRAKVRRQPINDRYQAAD